MTDSIGLVAALLVLVTFSMTSMVWLRLAAIGSNLAFLADGLSLGLLPIWLLHAILLPVNGVRLAQEVRRRARRRQGGRRTRRLRVPRPQ